ncbi:hypothetical protein TMatcc_007709 [Talaromyces marneffei ATCC 18224]
MIQHTASKPATTKSHQEPSQNQERIRIRPNAAAGVLGSPGTLVAVGSCPCSGPDYVDHKA